MSRFLLIFAPIVWLGGSGPSVADEPPARRAGRVMEGRVLDAQGKPAPGGRIMFGPVTPPIPFTESSTAALDAEGRFRIELTEFPLESGPLPANGPLRYLALAPGFRPEVGKIAAGPGPSTMDIRLTPEAWKSTDLLLIDRDGKPVPDAELTLLIGGAGPWARLSGDVGGVCRIATPPGQGFGISARREGYLTTTLGFRGTADDPARIRVPLLTPIRGRVVDPDGRPLPGIRVGRVIAPDHRASDPEARGRIMMYPLVGTKEPATTDGEGRFTLTPTIRLDSRTMGRSGEFRLARQALCFADEAFRRVAFAGVDLMDPQTLHEVTLRPARPVRIPIEHEVAIPSGDIESWWELTHFTDPARPETGLFVMDGLVTSRAPGGDSKGGESIEAHWPEGKYRIKINSADSKAERGLEEIERDLVIPPGEGPLVLPAIRLTASAHHRLIGQPAPEIDAKDLDSGEPVRLADFRGKIIVLDFWGYWCGPCVGSMPELAEVHRRFQGRPVVVLGLHDQSIQSREVYDRKLSGVKRSFWDGRDLPFRVALDRPDPELAADGRAPGNGVTCKRYDIHGFPTTLVIDRDGKVAGTVNALEHGRLAATIEELLAKDTPR